MLQIVYSSVRVRLLARAKLIFLREPDDFFSMGNPARYFEPTLFLILSHRLRRWASIKTT